MDLDLGGSGGSSGVGQLLEIETEAIGFQAFAGDAKVQLLQAWPTDALPPPTSSLLAVASKRGLLAAGGPTTVVVASTEAVREAFQAQGSNNLKPFTPQVTLELGIRISQVAFSSDESVLTVSAEQGGGLAVYEVENLLKNNTQTSLELPTGGLSVRALVPNPGEHPELFAIVTDNGNLCLANMKAKQLSSPLKESVSCVAWSSKGKQLVAGLLDGSALQMMPTGEVKHVIPKPPELGEDQYSSAVSWLRDDIFLVVHSSKDPSNTASTYHIINKDKSGNIQYQNLPERCGPWGMMERAPAYQFIQRMKDFPPNLQDVVILASTVSDEIGLYTRSKKPLATNVADPNSITGVFTATSMAIDSQRASLPMTDETTVSSPIGIALDLSSKALVRKPLPAEEMDESPTPLPALLVLNNMGVLAGWWFTYADSIRTGTGYPGLASVAQAHTQSQTPVTLLGSSSTSTPGGFGQSAFGGSGIKPATAGFGMASSLGGSSRGSIFGQTATTTPSQSAFGSSPMITPKPGFGASSSLGASAPAFGATSMLGGGAMKASPWGASTNKPSFGNASAIGSNASPWSAAGSGSSSNTDPGKVFGQPSTSAPQTSIFGSNSAPVTASSNSASTGSGFASFSGGGGFAALGKGPSLFASQPTSDTFGSNTRTSIFGTPSSSADNNLGSNNGSTSIFGSNSGGDNKGGSFGGGFNVGSSWTNQNPSKPVEKPQEANRLSLFGSDFGKTLGDAVKKPVVAESEEREMSDEMSDSAEKDVTPISPTVTRETTTPVEKPASSGFFTLPPAGSGPFGIQIQQKTTPAKVSSGRPTPSLFSIPAIKEESYADLPIPPDTTSKATFTPATSSATSTDSASKATPEPAPLPPDFVKPPAKSNSSISPETTESNTPVALELVKDAAATAKDLDAPEPTDSESKPDVKSKTDVSIFSKSQEAAPKTPTEQPKLFFSSEPDENEFETTDEEIYDSEGEEHEGDDDEDEDDEEEEEEKEDKKEAEEEEGSGVDVAEEITTSSSPKASTQNSFGKQESNLTDGSWANIKPPQLQQSQPRKNLFGEVSFLPKQPDNERSPSPERRAPVELLRSEGSRSVSVPNMAVKQKINLPRTMKQAPKPAVSFEQRRKEEQLRLADKAAQQRAQEEQPLEDDEDDSIRRLLASPIEPNTELEPFIAHQDYAALVSKAGVPGQIEKIYRDINSMIDTIGLNCRNMQAFTAGHEEGFKDGREIDDLIEPKNWTLVEVQDLKKVQQELWSILEGSRISNVQKQTQTIRRLQEDVTKLLARQRDVRAIIETQLEAATDAEQYRDLDLSAEQQNQRQTLRDNLKSFQAKLMETESAITMLRTKLATATSSTGKATAQKVPTMEAVGSTVRKMTQKIEEKSGDIDVLEARLRKLGITSATPSTSRQSSPYISSPSPGRNPRSSLLLSGSPLRASNTVNSSLDESIGASTMTLPGSGSARLQKPRKIAEYTAEDVAPFVRRAQRKKALMRLLRDKLVGKDGEIGVTVVGVE